MMKIDLKPCPFCGFDEARIITIRDGRMVTCHNCHASGPAYYHGLQGIGATPALAAEKWNRRADLSSPLGAVAMQDAALKAIMDIWAELLPKMSELELQHPAQSEIDAIEALPLPTHAALLAAALVLPEVQALVDAEVAAAVEAMREAAIDAIKAIWSDVVEEMAEFGLEHPAQAEIDAIRTVAKP
jgi:Lar family restriction alleviation protein